MGKRLIEVPLSDEIDASIADDINLLRQDLAAMGVRLDIPSPLEGGTLVFEYDSTAYKRNAGRKKKAVPTNSKLAEKTQEQMDEWLTTAPVADIQEELGISRATAYRRVNEARSRVEYAIVSLNSINEGDKGGPA